MSEPKSIEEIPNWVIVNALKCPIESQISIVAKLLQHLDSDQRSKALSMSGVSNSLCSCNNRFFDADDTDICGNCGDNLPEDYC